MIKEIINNKGIIEKIQEIAQILKHYNTKNNLSLMGGGIGVSMFLSYYAKLTENNAFADKSFDMISDIFDSISNGDNYPTFANGLAGLGWVLEHLSHNYFIKIDTTEVIGELDGFLYQYMIKEINTGNYDYLHNAGGIALYLLSRKSCPQAKKYLSEYVDILFQHSKKENNMLRWKSTIQGKENKRVEVYNLSLSHGMSSIVGILSKIYKLGINKEKTAEILNGAINYILSKQFDITNSLSYFPHSITLDGDKGTQSRLAWCYGDLGISVALWNASQALNDKKLENKSLEILLHSSKRRNLQENSVVDAGLCHGAAGIAHIFNRMFINTGTVDFKYASEYWFNVTLKMARFDDGLAGFKVWRTKDFDEWSWTNDYGFLEGIAGIGLALFSAVSDIEPAWDEALLLS